MSWPRANITASRAPFTVKHYLNPHVRAVCNGARRARKSCHGSARERRKKRERKKMSKGHKIKCSSHKVEAD